MERNNIDIIICLLGRVNLFISVIIFKRVVGFVDKMLNMIVVKYLVYKLKYINFDYFILIVFFIGIYM